MMLALHGRDQPRGLAPDDPQTGVRYDEIAIAPAMACDEIPLAGFAGPPAIPPKKPARIRGMTPDGAVEQDRRAGPTTGNKSEMAVGYCHAYGDMAGGLRSSRMPSQDRGLSPVDVTATASARNAVIPTGTSAPPPPS